MFTLNKDKQPLEIDGYSLWRYVRKITFEPILLKIVWNGEAYSPASLWKVAPVK